VDLFVVQVKEVPEPEAIESRWNGSLERYTLPQSICLKQRAIVRG